MDIFSILQQFGNLGGGCVGNACSNAATTVSSAAEATSAIGGFSGLFSMICKLFGIGC